VYRINVFYSHTHINIHIIWDSNGKLDCPQIMFAMSQCHSTLQCSHTIARSWRGMGDIRYSSSSLVVLSDRRLNNTVKQRREWSGRRWLCLWGCTETSTRSVEALLRISSVWCRRDLSHRTAEQIGKMQADGANSSMIICNSTVRATRRASLVTYKDN